MVKNRHKFWTIIWMITIHVYILNSIERYNCISKSNKCTASVMKWLACSSAARWRVRARVGSNKLKTKLVALRNRDNVSQWKDVYPRTVVALYKLN